MELDFLYLVRHIHKKRTHLPSVYEWIIAEDWSKSLSMTKKIIFKKILENDEIDNKIAEKKFDDAFKFFMLKIFLKYLINQGNGKEHDHLVKYHYYFKNYKKIIIEYLQKYPDLKKIFKFFDRRKKLKNSLILDKHHKFYKDFYPIYQILTSNKS